jgi:hypothetical protein
MATMNDSVLFKSPSRRRKAGLLLAMFNFAFWTIWIKEQSLQWSGSEGPIPIRVEDSPYFVNFATWAIPAIVSSGLLVTAFFYATKRNLGMAKRIVLCVVFLLPYLFSILYLTGAFANVFTL